MRACILSFCLVFGALLTGCVATADLEDVTSSASTEQAQPVGSSSFDENGLSEPISLKMASQARIALVATGGDDLCFTLEGQNSPARRASLDVVEPSTTSVRYQRIRCSTGTLLREPREDALEVSARQIPQPPEAGRVMLRVLVTEHSALFENPEALTALTEALTAELAPVGITPEVVASVHIEDAPSTVTFTDLETETLDALLAHAPLAPEETIDVVFAGCLRRLDPLGVPSNVAGFTGRIGGGGKGGADAIFLPGLRCDRIARGPVAFDPDASAHVLAHELGHFLGLSHTEDSDNIMHANPTLESAKHFSPSQALTMRSHPFVKAR